MGLRQCPGAHGGVLLEHRRGHGIHLRGAFPVAQLANVVGRDAHRRQAGDLAGVERVLFKTKNSSFWATPERGFRTDFAYLTPATAELLVEAGIVLVGIDYLSIEAPGAEGHPVHITLLEKEIVILEGLDLREISAGDYELICAPLKYDGATGDGSPARTFLVRIESDGDRVFS